MTAEPAAQPRPLGVTLSRADWIAAGQALLCAEGIAGMRLKKLTERLSVSTGSFYHHFRDMEDYLTALAEHFQDDQVRALVNDINRDSPDPRQRMRQLAIASLKSGLFELDMAMRIWATSDARAAASVRGSENVVLAFLERAFADAGFAGPDASLRAQILLSVRTGQLVTQDARAQADLRERTLELLLASAPRT